MMITSRSLIAFVTLVFSISAHAVEYKITFTGTWSANDISAPYPRSAHFSELVGASHQAGAEFWRNGGQASLGVEDVAELGSNRVIKSELAAANRAGTTGSIIEFRSLFNLPNSDEVQVEIEEDKPFITLISMIAPSPDWFVGVSGLSLLENGQWIRNLKVDLRPYDAGTEEGTGFSLSNPASPSSDTIFRLGQEDSPFIGRPVIATLEFTLLNPPEDPPVEEPPVAEPPTDRPSSVVSMSAIMNLLLND